MAVHCSGATCYYLLEASALPRGQLLIQPLSCLVYPVFSWPVLPISSAVFTCPSATASCLDSRQSHREISFSCRQCPQNLATFATFPLRCRISSTIALVQKQVLIPPSSSSAVVGIIFPLLEIHKKESKMCVANLEFWSSAGGRVPRWLL